MWGAIGIIALYTARPKEKRIKCLVSGKKSLGSQEDTEQSSKRYYIWIKDNSISHKVNEGRKY